MILLYIKKNALRYLFFALFLFFIMNMLITRQQRTRVSLYNDALHYLEQHEDSLQTDIPDDYERYIQKVTSIENLEGKEDISEEDRLDIFMLQYKITQSDMVWINSRLNAPGEVAPTVSSDRTLLRLLNNDYKPAFSLKGETENRILVETRNLRRYGDTEYEHKIAELSLENLKKIDTSYDDYYSVYGFSMYLPKLQSDYMFVLLIAVLSFSMFSSLREKGYLMWISTLRSSVNGFAIRFHLAGLMLVILSFLVYFGLFTGRIVAYLPHSEIFNAPAQVLVGSENLLFPLTVGEYYAVSGLVKCLFVMAVYSLVSLISLVSKNSIIAFALSALLCGGIMGMGNAGHGVMGALFSGDLSCISDYPYTNFFGEPVNSMAIIICVPIIVIILAALTVRFAAKKLCCNGAA